MSKQLLKLTDDTVLALNTLQLGAVDGPATRFVPDAKPLPQGFPLPKGPQPA